MLSKYANIGESQHNNKARRHGGVNLKSGRAIDRRVAVATRRMDEGWARQKNLRAKRNN